MTAPDIAALRAAYAESLEDEGALWQKLQDQRAKTKACGLDLLNAEVAPLAASGWQVERDQESYCRLTRPVLFSPYHIYIEARLPDYSWGASPEGPFRRPATSLEDAARSALVWAEAEEAWREQERQLPMALQVERALDRLLGKGWGWTPMTLKMWRKTISLELGGVDPGLSTMRTALQQCVESGRLERDRHREYSTPLTAR